MRVGSDPEVGLGLFLWQEASWIALKKKILPCTRLPKRGKLTAFKNSLFFQSNLKTKCGRMHSRVRNLGGSGRAVSAIQKV
jgi:hypothetical protein